MCELAMLTFEKAVEGFISDGVDYWVSKHVQVVNIP